MKTEKQKEYSKYLQSKSWKERRNKLREAWGNKCICCYGTENLHIHHMNYDCLGKETMKDAVLLCKGCHLNIHKGRLRIWFFTPEQREAYKQIKHIITDGLCDYISFEIKEKQVE